MRIFISKRKDYMDIFEEKRQLIEKIACQKEDTLESKLELKQLLLKDTNGGKLYKYRSFDKDGYSLKNLEEGTLHCSLVEAFNDPFDSKLGYTFESICIGVLGEKLEKIFLLIQTCKNVLEEKTKLEEYSADEQNEIKKYLSDEKIKAGLEKLIYKINSDDENMNDDVNIFFELLTSIYKNENTIKLLGTDIGSLLQILLPVLQENNLKIDDLENFDITYFANIMGIKEDADEVDTTLQLNRKFYLTKDNDIDEASEIIDKFDKELNEWANNIFRVGCLGTDYKNKLMWSHYADSHTGFCIEYDFNNIKWENLLVYPLENEIWPKGINAIIFLLYKPVGLGRKQKVITVGDKLFKFLNLAINKRHDYRVGFDTCFSTALFRMSVINKMSIDTCEASRFSMYIHSDLIATPCSFDNIERRYAFKLKPKTIKDAWESEEFSSFAKNQENINCLECSEYGECLGGCKLKLGINLC